MNFDAINIGMNTSLLCDVFFNSFGKICRRGIAGSKGISNFSYFEEYPYWFP